MMFEHFLITRFNLRNEAWKKSKNSELVLTAQWLKDRFRLFDHFCFPSVKNQTNVNFTWLVFFDIQTPESYKEVLNKYRVAFPNFTPLYIDGMAQFLSAAQHEVSKASTPYVITTRIDNDDCVSKYFIENIQSRFDQQDYMAIDFIDGYTLQIEPEVKAGKRRHTFNPFISLVEKNEHPKTIWHAPSHASWKREKNVMRIEHIRIWLSIIHFKNKVNEFVGYDQVDMNALFAEFRIADSARDQLVNAQKDVASWRFQSIRNKVVTHCKIFYKDLKRWIRLRNNK